MRAGISWKKERGSLARWEATAFPSSEPFVCIGGEEKREEKTVSGDQNEGQSREFTRYHAWPWSYDRRPSHPYNTGTEHVGFSLTRKAVLA